MPNILAFVALLSWPFVVAILFHTMTRSYAVCISIIGGYLLLPNEVGFDLPLLPALTKDSIPAIAAAVMLFFMKADSKALYGHVGYSQRKRDSRETDPIQWVIAIFVMTLVISSLFTVLNNREYLVYGPTFLPGLRVYDFVSIFIQSIVLILPFILGYLVLRSPESHISLVKVLVISGVLYSFPALFEARMSPQLNLWIYGFFPHSFFQHIRGDGYRPIVFLQHGLWLSIFFSMTLIAAIAFFRNGERSPLKILGGVLSFLWMSMVLVISKSLGALLIVLMFLPVSTLLRPKSQVIVSAILGSVILIYPLLRGVNAIPVQFISEIASKIDPIRAESFDFRIENEDALLEKANQKPAFGWGLWGRNELYDSETGRNISVTDGAWIIFIGSFGWFGYIARFGLLVLPILVLVKSRSNNEINFCTSGLCLVLVVNLIDLLPNATLTPLTWLISGAIAGLAVRRTSGLSSKDVLDDEDQVQKKKHTRSNFVRTPRR